MEKSKKRIKHISQLPKWFKLEKYAPAKNLDANGWYEQLIIRMRGLFYFTYDPKEEGYPPDIHKDPMFKEALEDIRNTPIFDVRGKTKLPMYFYFDDIPSRLKSKEANFTAGIHLMTLEEFEVVRYGIKPERLEYVANWVNQFIEFERDPENLKPPYIYRPWIKQPLTNSDREEKKALGFIGTDAAIIDLNYSDKILQQNFKKYLAARRKDTNTEHLSKYRQYDFSDWIRYGVLPYLDLMLWELESNTQIPYRIIADAIYPLGEGGEESVRKTTVPLATALIKEEKIRQLVGIAAIEIAERNAK